MAASRSATSDGARLGDLALVRVIARAPVRDPRLGEHDERQRAAVRRLADALAKGAVVERRVEDDEAERRAGALCLGERRKASRGGRDGERARAPGLKQLGDDPPRGRARRSPTCRSGHDRLRAEGHRPGDRPRGVVLDLGSPGLPPIPDAAHDEIMGCAVVSVGRARS
jgi:hypothetical protein